MSNKRSGNATDLVHVKVTLVYCMEPSSQTDDYWIDKFGSWVIKR